MANNLTTASVVPTRQFLYVSDPASANIIGNNANENSLLCYAYAQGYTHLVLYELSQFESGGVITDKPEMLAFITKAYDLYNIRVGFASASVSGLNAMIDFNSSYAAPYNFTHFVTELEHFNYSFSYPYNKQNDDGTKPFWSAYDIVASAETALGLAGIEIIFYAGHTKTDEYVYDSNVFEDVSVNTATQKIRLRGDFTNTGITHGTQFEVGQFVHLVNYPTAGNLVSTQISSVTLVAGYTEIIVTAGISTNVLDPDFYLSQGWSCSVGTNEFLIDGNKTWRFKRGTQLGITALSPVSAETLRVAYYPLGDFFSPPLIVEINATKYDGVWTYLNLTTPGSVPIGTGVVVPDVSGYYPTSTYPAQPCSELELWTPVIDTFWLHVYTPTRPRYNYADDRVRQVGLGAANLGVEKGLGFIVSAEPAFSEGFFIGTGGFSKKTPKDAYHYIVGDATSYGGPTQSGTPLYMQLETDPDSNDWLLPGDIAIFKDTLIRALASGNGSTLWCAAGADQNLVVASPIGSTPINGQHCDDGLPNNTRTVLWSVLSGPAGATFGNPASQNTTFNYIAYGVYVIQFQVTDSGGVSNTDTLQITVQNSAFSVNIVYDGLPIQCNGGSAVISVDITGGVLPMTYLWSPTGQTTAAITATAGTYTVTVTDALGNVAIDTLVVTQPTAITADFDESPVSCNGGSDGRLNVTPIGGTAPYTFLWAYDSSTNSFLNGIPAGTYPVTITDANGCTATVNGVVTEPTAISVSDTPQATNCPGSSTGQIDLTISGGTPFPGPSGYVILYNPTPPLSSVRATSIVDLPAGSYDITVIDANGCVATLTSVVPEASPITFTINANPTCFEALPATISVTGVTNGTAPYRYTIDVNGTILLNNSLSNSVQFTPVAGGLYPVSVTVTDANGCSATDGAIIEIHPEIGNLVITNTGDDPIPACPGFTAVLELTLNGSPVNADWSDGSIGVDTINIDRNYLLANHPGETSVDFTATYTDSLTGCTKQATYTLAVQYTTLTVTVTNNLCGGPGNVGAIDLTVTNGCAPYTFAWTSSVPGFVDPGTEDLTGLQDGLYSVTVSDSNVPPEVAVLNDIEVVTSAPTITGYTVVRPCPGTNSGSITVSASGGTAPYSVEWTKSGDPGFSAFGATITGLGPGTYTALLTDDNACTDTEVIVIAEVDIDLQAVVTNPTCSGDLGSIDLDPIGGNAPYTYFWSNGQTTQDISNLQPGSTHSVTVTDANGCVATQSFTMPYIRPVYVALYAQNPTTPTSNDGWIRAVSSGGTGLQRPQWNHGPTSWVISGLAPDTYTVVVTDFNGCTATGSITLRAQRLDDDPIPEDPIHRYKCCVANIGYQAALAERQMSKNYECLAYKAQLALQLIKTYEWIVNQSPDCLTSAEVANIKMMLDSICNDCTDCQ